MRGDAVAACRVHNPKVAGSNPVLATTHTACKRQGIVAVTDSKLTGTTVTQLVEGTRDGGRRGFDSRSSFRDARPT